MPDINQPLLGTTLHNFCSTSNRAGLPLIKHKGRGWQGTGKEKRKGETRGTWENTAGKEILIGIGWFWVKSGSLWHIWMHSLSLVLINDSCTIVCWQSLPYRHNFFFWYETLLKMQPNQIWPLNNMCYHHCTVNWDWLVTSCDKVGKRALSFSRKEKKKK